MRTNELDQTQTDTSNTRSILASDKIDDNIKNTNYNFNTVSLGISNQILKITYVIVLCCN